MNNTEKVNKGLPKNIKAKVFWVVRKNRISISARVLGGSDVVIHYHNDVVVGYDRIKNPSIHINKVISKEIIKTHDMYEDWTEVDQLEVIRKRINCIYARRYKGDDIKIVGFNEIWNCKTSTELPWKLLRNYNIDIIIEPDTKANKVEKSSSLKEIIIENQEKIHDFVANSDILNKACVCGLKDDFSAIKTEGEWVSGYPEFDELMDHFVEEKDVIKSNKVSLESRDSVAKVDCLNQENI